MNIKPEDIITLNDIKKLPFTTKDDLRDAYPFEMFAVPRKEIVEVIHRPGQQENQQYWIHTWRH